jgi:hypothetical protein
MANANGISRQYRWQRKRLRAGLCRNCGQTERFRGSIMCLNCLKKQRLRRRSSKGWNAWKPGSRGAVPLERRA